MAEIANSLVPSENIVPPVMSHNIPSDTTSLASSSSSVNVKGLTAYMFFLYLNFVYTISQLQEMCYIVIVILVHNIIQYCLLINTLCYLYIENSKRCDFCNDVVYYKS